MGIAWLAAGIATVWVAWAKAGGKRNAAIGAAALLVLSLFYTAAPRKTAQFSLEGFSFPVERSAPTEEPALLIGSTAGAAAKLPVLRVLSETDSLDRPVALHVDPVPPDSGWGVLRLDLPPQRKPAMIGFEHPGRPFPFSNVIRLVTGDTIVVQPDGDESARKVLVVDDEGAVVGPCDLSGEPGSVFGGGRAVRTLSLLDLYHYAESRCVPLKVGEGSALWPSRAVGSTEPAIRSFLIITRQATYLAQLDPPSHVRLTGEEVPSEAIMEARGPGPATLVVLEPRFEIDFDRLYLDEVDTTHAYCETGYEGDKDAEDLSGSELCKRIKVYLVERRFHLYVKDRLLVVPEQPPIITVRPDSDADRHEPLTGLRASYTSGTDAAPAAHGRVLSFPVRLDGSEPLTVDLAFQQGEDCGSNPSPCLVATTSRGVFSYPVAALIGVGGDEGEHHLFRATIFDHPWWLGWLVIGVMVLQWGLLARNIAPGPAITMLGAIFVLLGARILFGFKVLSSYPHDPEGLVSGLIGLMLLPALFCVASATRLRRDGVARIALAIIAGSVPLIVLDSKEIISIVGWGPRKGHVGLVAALAVLLTVVVLLARRGRGWARRWLRTRAHAGGRERVRFWGPIVVLVAIRWLMAALGWERIGPVPVIAWYWPCAIIAVMPVLHHYLDRQTSVPSGWRVLGIVALTVAVVAGAPAWPRGDIGAAMVLAPAMVFAALVTWRPLIWNWGRLRTGHLSLVVVVLVLIFAAGYWGRRAALDGAYPQVEWVERWSDEGSLESETLCPSGETATAAPLDLSQYQDKLRASRTEIRRNEYFLPGASRRIGTRLGAQVDEFLSILRRYAVGASGRWRGDGYNTVAIRRYGRSEVDAQLSDGVPSVLLSSEGGIYGVLGLLLVHFAVVAALMRRQDRIAIAATGVGRPLLFAGAACVAVPAWTTFLMAAGNFGLLPLTGQSTPLLAVGSGSDVILAPALWVLGLLLTSWAAESGEER